MLYFSRWKTTLIWLAVLAGVIFAAPNLFTKQQLADLPDWFPHRQLTLGLDLQGGSHILLRVERADIEEERLETVVDDMRRLLREEGIGYTGLSGNDLTAQVRIRDSANVERAKEALAELTQPVAGGLLGGGIIREAEIDEPQPGFVTDHADGRGDQSPNILRRHTIDRKLFAGVSMNWERPSRSSSARAMTGFSSRFRDLTIRSV